MYVTFFSLELINHTQNIIAFLLFIKEVNTIAKYLDFKNIFLKNYL